MDAHKLLSETETVYEQTADYLRDGARLLHDNEGELFTQPEAIDLFETELELTESVARKVLTQLVGDSVDPVIQLISDGTKYIGVIEFHTFDGAYGYVGFDPIYGKERRAVCQQCVDESATDGDVTTVTGTELCGPSSDDVAWDELVDALHDHYDGAHSQSPASVESSVAATGAELKSGTLIGGNTAVHDGRSGEVPIKVANANALQNQTPGGEGGIATSSEVDNKSISKKGIVTSLDDQTDLTLENPNSTSVTDANGDLSDLSSPLQFTANKARDSDQLDGFTTTGNTDGNTAITTTADTYTDEQAQDAVGTILQTPLKYSDTNDQISLDTSGFGVDVSNDGGEVTSGASDLNFSTDLTATDDTDGTSTIEHANTSTQSNVTASNGSAITSADLDGNGHVTSLGTTDFDTRFDNFGSWTIEEGDGEQTNINSGEKLQINGSSQINTEITSTGGTSVIDINHNNTSSQGNVSAPSGGAINDIDLDGNGHVTSLGTTDFDSRFDNFGSWTIEEGDGEQTNINSGEKLQINGSSQINTEITSTGGTSVIDINHNNTSSQGNVSVPSGGAINDIDIDGNGHVTSLRTTDFDSRFDNYSGFTYQGGDGKSRFINSGETIEISGGTDLNTELIRDGSTVEIEVNHNTTSGQGDVTTGGATIIDDIFLDGRGHVDNINTQNRSLDDWQNPNAELDLDGNGINFGDPSNQPHGGIRNIGSIDFQDQENSDTPANNSTMAYDASEGFLFNDDIETSGVLRESDGL